MTMILFENTPYTEMARQFCKDNKIEYWSSYENPYFKDEISEGFYILIDDYE